MKMLISLIYGTCSVDSEALQNNKGGPMMGR